MKNSPDSRKTTYCYDGMDRPTVFEPHKVFSFQHEELISFEEEDRKIEHFYDSMGGSSVNNATYRNDSLYNRTEKNGVAYQVNSLNELLACEKASYEYDLRGNQVLKNMNEKQFTMAYDPLDRLIEVKSENENDLLPKN